MVGIARKQDIVCVVQGSSNKIPRYPLVPWRGLVDGTKIENRSIINILVQFSVVLESNTSQASDGDDYS